MTIRERSESELNRLNDEELLRYVVAARRAGRDNQANTALGIFVFRRYDDLVRHALTSAPSREDAEDLAQQAIADAVRATFNGSVPGEAYNFVFTILKRRIADFHEKRNRGGGPALPLPEDLDDEESGGRSLAIEEDFAAAVDARDVVERAKASLSAAHQRVVDLYLQAEYDAQEVAKRVNEEFPDLRKPMTDANVHQIATRFRRRLRDQLEP